MMNNKQIVVLNDKTKEELLVILSDVANHFDGVGEFIALNYLLSPIEKIKQIKKTYALLKRRTRFHNYHQTIEFFHELTNSVLMPLGRLKNSVPEEIVKLLQTMVDDFEKLFESKDDSSGCAMDFLHDCCELWGDTWCYISSNDVNRLSELVAHYYKNQGYIGIELIRNFKSALGKTGLIALEEQFQEDHDAFFYVIECQNDPDKYQKTMLLYSEESTEHCLTLATLFFNNGRIKETIDTLKKHTVTPDNNSQHYKKCQDLLIQSFIEVGEMQEAKNEQWKAFVCTLNTDYYRDFIQHLPSDAERDNYRVRAIEEAFKNNNWVSIWTFLEEIQAYDLLSKHIISHRENLASVSVKKVRDTSKVLAKQSYFLTAVLMRRVLIESVLANAQSRYYKYAASDLKLAIQFGEKVSDWHEFSDNSAYINDLKSKHSRKVAFWSLVADFLA